MSVCSRNPSTSRRRAAVMAGAAAAIAGSAPALLDHAGRSGWTDAAFGCILGLSLGLMVVAIAISARGSQRS